MQRPQFDVSQGLFGGLLSAEGEGAREAVPEAVAAALVGKGTAGSEVDGVDRIPFAVEGGVVRWARDLTAARALASLDGEPDAAIRAIAKLARALARCHAAGIVVGSLDPELARVLPGGGVALIAAPAHLTPHALLRARLVTGASPELAAFIAPEQLAGGELSAPSDVYALAATAFRVLAGRPPLGQIDFARAADWDADGRLGPAVARALAAAPLARPSAHELAAVFEAAVGPTAEDAGALAPEAMPAVPSPKPHADEAPPAVRATPEVSGILATLLALGGVLVFIGAVWLVRGSWGSLGRGTRLAFLGAVTAALLATGPTLERRGFARSGTALLVLGIELLWANGAYLLDMTGALDSLAAWSLLAGGMTAIGFAAAAMASSGLMAVFAALHLAVFAGVLGAHLRSGSETGPSTYLLLVAGASALVAFAGHRLRRERLGLPFAALAALAAVGSATTALLLVRSEVHGAFGSVWPYGVVAILAISALAARGRYADLAGFAAGLVLFPVPTVEALLRHQDFATLLAAVAIGFAVVGVALAWPRLRGDGDLQAAWVAIGLTSAVAGTSVLFLAKCHDQDGLATLRGAEGPHLLLVPFVSAALLGGSYGLGRFAKHKSTYRLIEIAALAQFFGTFSLQALLRHQDPFYPVVLFGVAAGCLALGAVSRHATLVVLPAATLVVNVSIQYFARLWDILPASVLILGFGLAVLAGGVHYERRLKHLLPRMLDWK